MTFGTIFKVVITLGFLGIGCYFQYLGFLAKRVKQDIETKKKSGEMISTIDFVNQVNEVSKQTSRNMIYWIALVFWVILLFFWH
ncbi:hypothetical protein [Fructilactobacillus sanfranciscensis]|uniref:hypothetical protein n=1 Tax=Fructilactobacillus sanfranciscensis TaxID=1625 RepID=UPI000CD41651|nr:hypothetical protein [Fructilactobacillus sanfranciscensis]POH19083.1 hypothetical protein BGL45_05895 [Fructilactobacillus sanfranciscensis]